ncbi:unnamed protein product [Knipowitschia caucasica]
MAPSRWNMFVLVVFLTLQQALGICVPEFCPTNAGIQKEIVDIHNQFRRDVQPPAQDMLMMSWDDEAMTTAQAWVDKCKRRHGPPSSRLYNGTKYELGENLFFSSSAKSWRSVITAWHNEVEHFTYPNISAKGKATGHYTQVIWNSSYKVGCGMTKCPGNIHFYGCQYYRAGNFRSWRPYTEGEACGMCPGHCVDKLCTNPCPYVNKIRNCGDVSKDRCKQKFYRNMCQARCECDTEIIPVYKK